MGCAVGFLSGMFGIGGGFLLTPLLIFMGVPPAVAVGTGSMQILASSVSGAIAQYRRKNVDVKMGAVLVAGGVFGSVIGVALDEDLAADRASSICSCRSATSPSSAPSAR